MKTIFDYQSASVALEELKSLGYQLDYNVEFDNILQHSDDYVIDYLYRYEGASNHSDESSTYGIRNTITGEKGIFVAGNLSLIEGKKRDIIINLEIKAKNASNNH